MKRFIYTASLLLIAMATLNSCVKGYTCVCYLNVEPDHMVLSSTTVSTKKAAEKSCAEKTSWDYHCSIKK